MKRYMNIKQFKKRAEKKLGELEKLIQQMPQKGDKSEHCQRLCIQQTINQVYYAINGTKQEDLEK